jgi:hypothetical protein
MSDRTYERIVRETLRGEAEDRDVMLFTTRAVSAIIMHYQEQISSQEQTIAALRKRLTSPGERRKHQETAAMATTDRRAHVGEGLARMKESLS